MPIHPAAGTTATNGKVNPTSPPVTTNPPDAGGDGNPNDNPGGGGGYGGYYGGGGGGGSGSGPSDQQRQAAANLGGIVGYNMETLKNASNQADKVFDISDEQNRNLRDEQTRQARRNAGDDWFAQQLRLQSVLSQLLDAGGNAFNGSGLYDLQDMVARKDDMDDVEVLDTLRENLNDVNNDYFQSLAATNNSRNEQYMKTESSMRELAADYVAQLNNIHPDLVGEGVIDTENHTLNIPDWLTTSWFDDHVRDALKPEQRMLVRPNAAASGNWQRGLLTGDKNTASAGNQSYRNRLLNGYERRNQ